MNKQKRLASYPILFDGTIDIGEISKDHKCDACTIGLCEDCMGFIRCDCASINHGRPEI